MENPLKMAVLAELRGREESLSEYELLTALAEHDALQGLAEAANLALFQRHFLLMNALYQLQRELFEEGLKLSISALAIELTPIGNAEQELPAEGGEAKVAEYYLDWQNFENTDEAGVEALLGQFWQRFTAVDQLAEAFNCLDLPTDASALSIKQRYRQLARDSHPDRGGDTEQFLAVRQAYECLRGAGRV